MVCEFDLTIHDELILELIKPDNRGIPIGKIIDIIGTSQIEYTIEWMNSHPSPDVRARVPTPRHHR
jgi:hypothetical protein